VQAHNADKPEIGGPGNGESFSLLYGSTVIDLVTRLRPCDAEMMQAKALICDGYQTFSIQDVKLPDPGDDDLVIRTHTSGVSVGTEFALIRNKLSWGPYPLCTGYMGTGVVETVGDEVEGFSAGDAVYYRKQSSIVLSDGTDVSCVSGGHCSHIVTEPGGLHGVAKIIPGAAMDVVSMFVLPAVGLNGVDIANPRLGQIVVVHGVGLIGLGVVAACVNRGCTVIAVDIDDRQLEMAEKMGADVLINAGSGELGSEVERIAPDGADVVFECTGVPACIDTVIALCRRHGSFVWQGNYGADPVSINFLSPHGKRLKMFFPCDDGGPDCRRAVIKQMAMGKLAWENCITHRVSYAEAPELFRSINESEVAGTVGAVIDWHD
jgi:2-desacetyl-2-hydroxyethyl bacteriochlorophyllide A dehydrogenase